MPAIRHLPPAILRAARRLGVDVECARVWKALVAAGVHPILLKGPAVARWLYETGERDYGDIDLLISSGQASTATETLRSLGFAEPLKESPGDRRRIAREWYSPAQRPPVDLHTNLLGVGVDDELAWSLLTRDTEFLEVAGVHMRSLGIVARTLHIAMHAGQHGRAVGHVIEDLARAVEQVPIEVWRKAAALARELDATGVMRAGLVLDAKGSDVLEHISLPTMTTVDSQLLSSSLSPWPLNVALALEWASKRAGVMNKVRYVLRRVFRSPAWMREHEPGARDGMKGLTLAYVRRLKRLMESSPAAFRAWIRARRAAGRP